LLLNNQQEQQQKLQLSLDLQQKCTQILEWLKEISLTLIELPKLEMKAELLNLQK
jgi:hypothetical protein